MLFLAPGATVEGNAAAAACTVRGTAGDASFGGTAVGTVAEGGRGGSPTALLALLLALLLITNSTASAARPPVHLLWFKPEGGAALGAEDLSLW